MPHTKLFLAAASACACALLALPTQAKTALIDFGNNFGSVTSSGGLTYNAPNFNGTTDTTDTVGLNATNAPPSPLPPAIRTEPSRGS